MEQYKSTIQNVIDELKKLSINVENILGDNEELTHIKTRLLQNNERQISALSIQFGIDFTPKHLFAPTTSNERKPLTKAFGKTLAAESAVAAPAEKQLLNDEKPVQANQTFTSAQELEAAEFKEKAVALYAKFLDIEDEAIIDQYDEMVIRGVGKLANLPVTETNPKKIDLKFIGEIKTAIKQKLAAGAGDGKKGDEKPVQANQNNAKTGGNAANNK